MLYLNKPVYLAANADRRLNNDNDDNKRSDPNLTYHISATKRLSFWKKCLQNSLKSCMWFR